MNKKKLLIIVVALAIILVIAAAVFIITRSNDTDSTTGSSSRPQGEVTACSLFSLDAARAIFGDNLSEDPKNGQAEDIKPPSNLADAPNSQIEITTCGYFEGEVPAQDAASQTTEVDDQPIAEDDSEPSEGNQQSQPKQDSLVPPATGGRSGDTQRPSDPIQKALIVLRTTSTQQAASDFNSSRPEGSEDVSGYGQRAYWSQGQATSGEDVGQLSILRDGYVIVISGQDMSLETAKRVADVIITKLPEE